MNLKNLLLGTFLIFTTVAFSQEQIVTKTESVTKFQLKTTNIEDLKDFNWSTINELFENNTPDQYIELAFEYDNTSKRIKSKPNIKNLKFEVSGTTDELPGLIEKSKKMLENFITIDEKYN
ncbi:hypothetical protein SAMN04488552_0239 [Christiangramia echinicola]|uniref:Uncharacterized protein n=2 Tax=Christiangramia echinicola TaxID=279359 RepID=A0A1H1KVN4_9FLAO|nr:hypothetical protein SAMN04488552_0239 [Christiangramia echinicola]